MGQKTHPIGFRLGVIRTWSSKWYEEKRYAEWLHEDIKIRAFIKDKLNHAGISKIEIERMANKVKVNVFTARPGIVSSITPETAPAGAAAVTLTHATTPLSDDS